MEKRNAPERIIPSTFGDDGGNDAGYLSWLRFSGRHVIEQRCPGACYPSSLRHTAFSHVELIINQSTDNSF